jgi:hypothetical protein
MKKPAACPQTGSNNAGPSRRAAKPQAAEVFPYCPHEAPEQRIFFRVGAIGRMARSTASEAISILLF